MGCIFVGVIAIGLISLVKKKNLVKDINRLDIQKTYMHSSDNKIQAFTNKVRVEDNEEVKK